MPLLLNRREAIARAASALTLALAAPAKAGDAAPPFALPPAMRRGFNLPDQVPARHDRIAGLADLKRLRALGMTHVRLPVVAEAVLPDFSGPVTLAAALDDLDAALTRLLDIGFCVSVDLHPGSDFQAASRAEPERALKALRSGWRGLAARLARWPSESVFAELLNEPAMEDRVWRPFAEDLAREIRASLPKTTIVVGPAPYQRVDALARWTPFADGGVVYAAHYYDPMIFTHQGLTWDDKSPFARLRDVPFPLRSGEEALARLEEAASRRGDAGAAAELKQAEGQAFTPETISRQFEELARWSAEHHAPVIVNEFGALRFASRRSDRLAWLTAVRRACEAQGFGWAHWDYSGGFGLLSQNGQIDRELIEALLPRG